MNAKEHEVDDALPPALLLVSRLPKIVHKLWSEYEAKTIPADMDAKERGAVRHAYFHAMFDGMVVMNGALRTHSISNDDIQVLMSASLDVDWDKLVGCC